MFFEQRLQFVVVQFGLIGFFCLIDWVFWFCLVCSPSAPIGVLLVLLSKIAFFELGGGDTRTCRMGFLALGGVEVVRDLSSIPWRRVFIRFSFPAARFSIWLS